MATEETTTKPRAEKRAIRIDFARPANWRKAEGFAINVRRERGDDRIGLTHPRVYSRWWLVPTDVHSIRSARLHHTKIAGATL